MKIVILRNIETLNYAAEELKKYLEMMDSSVSAEITTDKNEEGITLGLLSDLGLDESDVNDPMIDDVVDVKLDSLHGYIAGSNERSVLFGVYKYLKSAGCRWVRPGDEGEYIPKADMQSHKFTFRKKADYPFRGQCIEGAVGYEHLRDVVLWMPKVDMNLFMIEQIVPYNYMNRWYRHTQNTKLPHDDIPYEDYCDYCLRLEHLIKKVGMQLHVMGHGALLEPFGVRHMISGQHYDVPEETKKAFALVDGKRELYWSSPFFTHLCMSQEWIQDKVVDWLANYLKEKPYIDFLHFWLADASNNQCECEECVKKHPSDWYVDMLNKLDAKLTEQGNPAKIIFIMYVDTLWPPEQSRLNNPDRFIMTTACGTGKAYSAKRREGGIPKWKRNDFAIQGGLDMALTFKDGWKCTFDGPSFIYEYWFYTHHYADPGYMEYARGRANDIKQLYVTGFDGIMSDGSQRTFFPTGLPLSIVGEFLFDTSIDTEKYIDSYLADAFGNDWKEAKEYLEKISASFDVDALAQKTDITAQDTGVDDKLSKKAGIFGNEPVGDIIAKVPDIVDAFAPTLKKNLELKNECHKESWRILTYHGEYCKGLSKIYFALSRNDTDAATKEFEKLMDYLSEVELDIQFYFDLCLFHQRTSQLIEGR
ncbi:MAG: DUF4838 domain-containing protein [Clostridia bacterium]|nr:DUF4838 domain-containing protein [Clostridia bacterium]